MRLGISLGELLFLRAWQATCLFCFGAISYAGGTGRPFLSPVLRPGFSDPDAGGVGGKARFGGGEGSGGMPSFCRPVAGVAGRDGVRAGGASAPARLRLFMALRGMDADLGRGTYDLPSFTTTLASFGVDFVLGTGVSSATSITGLSAMHIVSLTLEVVGDIGVYPVLVSWLRGLSCDSTGDTGVLADWVLFFQLAVLDAEEEVLVTSGAGFSGIWSCGLAFRRRLGPVSAASSAALSTARLGYGCCRSFLARLLCTRSVHKT